MPGELPPPPVNDQPGSFTWMEWYRQLRNYVSTSGSVPWYIINFAGSNITDIAARDHGNLQGLQGGTAGQHYHLTAAQHAALAAGLHNDLAGLQGGSSTERYHMTGAQNTAVSHLTWNSSYGTIDIDMGFSDATQQVGLELYRFCHNETGATIPNGSAVEFDGAHSDHVKIKLATASTTLEPNRVVGITTSDILNGEHGYVTWYGLVHDLDCSGSSVGETWAVGDVLYLHPTIPGKLTKVKPSVPYVTLPMAGIVNNSSTVGVLAVKITPSPRLYYGTFRDTTTQTIGTINTAQTITLNSTDDSSGVSIGTPTSRLVVANSGRYQLEFSGQLTSTSASSKVVYFWYRKNGTNVNNSTRKITIAGAATVAVPSWTYSTTLMASDYVELCWASDSTDVSLTPAVATAFAPSSSSIKITLYQINQ